MLLHTLLHTLFHTLLHGLLQAVSQRLLQVLLRPLLQALLQSLLHTPAPYAALCVTPATIRRPFSGASIAYFFRESMHALRA